MTLTKSGTALRRAALTLVGLSTTIALVTGCSGSGGSSGSSDVSIGVITLYPAAFNSDFVKGAQEQAAKIGVKLTVDDSNSDPAKETQLISQFVTSQVDAIVVSAVSPNSSSLAIQQAVDAGIPVICANTCLTDADTATYTKAFVASNQEELGSLTGQALVKYVNENLGGKAKIAMLTCEQFDVCKKRRAGIDQELAKIDAQIVASQEAYQADTSATAAQTRLTAHPDVDIRLTENEGATEGGVAALASSNLIRPVKAFGIDMTSKTADQLLSGDDILQMTTGQDPLEMGALSIQAAHDVLSGKTIEPLQYSKSIVFSRDDLGPINGYLEAHK